MSEIFDFIDAMIEDQRAIGVSVLLVFLFPILSILFYEPNNNKKNKRR